MAKQTEPTNNMAIWDQVETTDPDMTERVNFGAFRFTTIDAMYQIRRVTEVFGPCGVGWGIRNSRFEMLTIDPADPHYNLLQFTAQLWYRHGGQDGCLDIAADIELFEHTKNGWKRVSDPMKKVRTDALTKGLSWLGFSADVFMGRFDDAKYVQRLQQEKRAEQQVQAKPPAQNGDKSHLARPLPAATNQRDNIKELCGQLNMDGTALKEWLHGYGWTWKGLTQDQALQAIDMLQGLADADAVQLSNEFELDRAAGKVPA
jgi:hypothetical protein